MSKTLNYIFLYATMFMFVYSDNHDLSVYMCWDPERIEGPPEKSKEIMELYQQDIAFLKLRTQILYATSAAVDVVKSTDGTRNKCVEELKTILNDWKNLYTKTTGNNHVPIRQVMVTS